MARKLKWRKKVIVAKVETTYGVDATPTGAANAIQISDATITPMEYQGVSRGLVRLTMGSEGELPVGLHVVIDFATEIAGSGAAGTVPKWGALMRGAGMSETISAGVDVTYQPVSENHESLSIYFNQDGTLHKLLGARGNCTIEFDSQGVPRYRWRFVGLWADPAAVALPAADFTGWQVPKAVSNANTPDCRLHAYAAVAKKLSIDLGNRVEHRDLVNDESVEISDRQGKGSISIEAPPVDTQDFFAIVKAATAGALQWVHGTAAGHIVQIDAPAVQLARPKYSEDRGVTMLDMDLILQPSAGDDELVITAK